MPRFNRILAGWNILDEESSIHAQAHVWTIDHVEIGRLPRMPFAAHLEDPGLANHLYEDSVDSVSWGIRCLYYQLRSQVAIHGRNLATINSHQTRGGLYVPFLMQKKNKPLTAISFDLGEMPSDKSLVGLTTLKKRHPDLSCIVLTQRKEGYLRDDKTLVLPWTWVV